MPGDLPLQRIENILKQIRDNAGTGGGGGAMLDQAKEYTDTKADEVLDEAKSYTDAHEQKENPHGITPAKIGAETPAGAQAKANAAESNAKSYADSLVQDMETTAGAQAKANAAESNAKSYADSLVQDMETTAGAQAKANAAESNAKSYADSLVQDLETKPGAQSKADTAEANAKQFTADLLAGEADAALQSIVLESPNGTRFAITVDDEGNLTATEIES